MASQIGRRTGSAKYSSVRKKALTRTQKDAQNAKARARRKAAGTSHKGWSKSDRAPNTGINILSKKAKTSYKNVLSKTGAVTKQKRPTPKWLSRYRKQA